MIAKHVPMNSAKKSDFAGLVKYLTNPQSKNERVGNIRITNCQSDQAEIAALEVLNTQAQNTRSRADKTYHLIVSFRSGEQQDEATLAAIEERISAALGFADHQRVSVVHHDTDNLHLHIAISKIHPTRHTIHEPFNAYHTLGHICDKLEREYGLEKDNHTASKVGGENRADDMERHADVESLLGWIKRECKNQIHDARSWSDLHRVMREHGLEIRERANGLVIATENGVAVKASSVSREFSKARMEERLGSFQPSTERSTGTSPSKRYDRKPMRSRVNTVELHARYKAAQQQATSTRAAEWASAIARKKRHIEDSKRAGRLKRAAIKLMKAPGLGKKLMYTATSKSLRKAIAAINKQYLKDRQQIYERYKRRTWADWLRLEAAAGDQEALAALRARVASTGLMGNTVGGTGSQQAPGAHPGQDSVTKKGTIIYSVGGSAVRDDGSKLNVSRGASHAALEAALRMAIERYDNRITVNGSATFKEQIARVAVAANLSVSFDDDALERRRRQLMQPTTKENKHGSSSKGAPIGGRTDRSGDGHGGQAAASRAPNAARSGTANPSKHGHGHANGAKPYAGRARQAPPPEARNRMRGVSALGVVRVTNGSEVLLPGHVPGHMEHQRAKPDHGMRRPLYRPGRLNSANGIPAAIDRGKPNVGRAGTAPPPAGKARLRRLSQLGAIVIGESDGDSMPSDLNPNTEPTPRPDANAKRDLLGPTAKNASGIAAAGKYIFEREQKRLNGFDIPKHRHYTFNKDGTVTYAGIRQIDGQALALLKFGDEVMVLAVDDATARRIKRMAVGQKVGLSAKGAIRAKGRGR